MDRERALPRYIFATLQTNRTRRHFQINAKRAINQASLNQQDLKSLSVMLPPMDKQNGFARYAEATATAQATETAMLKGAEATLESLLARTFG
jgi:type I restriction enzyme S subunit